MLNANGAGLGDPADVVDAVAEAQAVLAAMDVFDGLALSDECLAGVPAGSQVADMLRVAAAAALGMIAAHRITGPAEPARQALAASCLAKLYVV